MMHVNLIFLGTGLFSPPDGFIEAGQGPSGWFTGSVFVDTVAAPSNGSQFSASSVHFIPELLPDILEGRIEPGRVFDRTVDLDGVPDGYRYGIRWPAVFSIDGHPRPSRTSRLVGGTT